MVHLRLGLLSVITRLGGATGVIEVLSTVADGKSGSGGAFFVTRREGIRV